MVRRGIPEPYRGRVALYPELRSEVCLSSECLDHGLVTIGFMIVVKCGLQVNSQNLAMKLRKHSYIFSLSEPLIGLTQ